MKKENIFQKSESALIAKKIFVEKMNFQRNQIASGVIRLTQSSIGKNIDKLDEKEYKCSLTLKMSDEEETVDLEIVISGIFEFQSELNADQKEIIITKNTMSILFPYLRAQVTLMTAQPDIEPVVIPAININALLQNLDE
jgi:preprotein translocase subunit SecB